MSKNLTEPDSRCRGLIEIGPRELVNGLAGGRVRLVDVREPAEHAGERIRSSELMPLSAFASHRLDLESEQEVVLYCRSGNRSAQFAARLLEAGWERVAHLRGGLEAWKAAGLDIDGDGRAPISLERQVRIVAGTLVAAGVALGATLSGWWLVLPALVGAGLVFAGVTDSCGMAMVLARLPYNQRVRATDECALTSAERGHSNAV